MIKEISFNEIKLYWKILWPDLPEKDIGYVALIKCEYVAPIFFNLAKQSPKSIPSIFIGYFIDDKIVGVLNGYKTSVKFFRSRGLWVDPDYRKQGIATKLMNHIEMFAISQGCSLLWSIPRKSAIDFYTKYGFKQTSDFILFEGGHCFAAKTITGDSDERLN